MSDTDPELTPPLLLTDRPWSEIEAERAGPPFNPGPAFGVGPLQEFLLPTSISPETWKTLSDSLRKRYEPAPPPEPILMIGGPEWWEWERSVGAETGGAGWQDQSGPLSDHAKHRKDWSVDQVKARTAHEAPVERAGAAASDDVLARREQWLKFMKKVASKRESWSNELAEANKDFNSLAKNGQFIDINRRMEEMSTRFGRYAAADAKTIMIVAKIDRIFNNSLVDNLMTGAEVTDDSFWGLKRIEEAWLADPVDINLIAKKLELLEDKANDYISRPSALKGTATARTAGPNGLPTIAANRIGDNRTLELHRSATRDATTGSRTRTIELMLQNERLPGERSGPNRHFRHGHVDGNAQDNIIVRHADLAVMGFVDGHISTKPQDRRNAKTATQIEGRQTAGQMVRVIVIDGELHEVV